MIAHMQCDMIIKATYFKYLIGYTHVDAGGRNSVQPCSKYVLMILVHEICVQSTWCVGKVHGMSRSLSYRELRQ